jgi:hypothetical protein
MTAAAAAGARMIFTSWIYLPHLTTFVRNLLLLHACNGSDKQLVAFVEREVSIGDGLADARQVLSDVQEVTEVQQQVEVSQEIDHSPAFFASSADSISIIQSSSNHQSAQRESWLTY